MELKFRQVVINNNIRFLIALLIGLLLEFFVIYLLANSRNSFSNLPDEALFNSLKTIHALVNPIVLLTVLFMIIKNTKITNPYSLSFLIGLTSTLIILFIDFAASNVINIWNYFKIFPSFSVMIFAWIIMFQTKYPRQRALSIGFLGFLIVRGFIESIRDIIVYDSFPFTSIVLGLFLFGVVALIFEFIVKFTMKLFSVEF